MITAFYTPYCKFLQKDNYIKYFDNEVNSLQELIEKIKVTDKIVIYAYSKDIIKFQFFNTDSNLDVSYQFLEEESIFSEIIKGKDSIVVVVKEEWQQVLGEKVYLIQDREKQMNIVKEKDILAFQFTDLVDLVKNLFNFGDIGTELVVKMNCTDEEIKRENLLDKKITNNIK